jgi:glutamate synthase domain-containing protein 3
LEKTVTVERYSRSSVVTFETGTDVLKFIAGLLRAYERYGKLNGAQILVVDRCTEHHGFAKVTPRDQKNVKAKSAASDKAKARVAAAGR